MGAGVSNASVRRVAVALVAAVAAALTPIGPVQAQSSDERSYIVVLRDRTESRGVSREHADAFGARVADVYERALRGYAARIPERHLARLRADPRVAFVAPNLPVEAAGFVPLSGDFLPHAVRRTGAATLSTSRQASTVSVAVIDSGIDLTHPDLNAHDGANCVNRGATATDDTGHGTHVAGAIGARNNGIGVVGVAPGTPVYAVKVLDAGGSGTTSNLICGLEWAVANSGRLNIRVLNLSLTVAIANDGNCGRTNNDPVHLAVCNATNAGLHIVAAAGNQTADLATRAPANYPEVLAVTSMADSDGQPGGFGGATCRGGADDSAAASSNFATAPSEIAHTLAAPGECVRSTWRGGGYDTRSGTSMASAHMAGSVALCIGDGGVPGRCAAKSPAQVIQQMRSDAAAHSPPGTGYGFAGDPNSPVPNRYYGHLVWNGQVASPVPVVSGATFFVDGSSSRSGPAGTTITAFATGAEQGVPYKLVTGRDGGNPSAPCSTDVVPVNESVRYAGDARFIGNVSGPVNRPAGTWQVCFWDSSPGGPRTFTGVATFRVQ